MNLTHDQWRAILDDSDIAPSTLVRILRGDPVSGSTARRIARAVERVGCGDCVDKNFVIVEGDQRPAGVE